MKLWRLEVLCWWRFKLWARPFQNLGPLPVEGPAKGAVFALDFQIGPFEIRWHGKPLPEEEEKTELPSAETMAEATRLLSGEPKKKREVRRYAWKRPPPGDTRWKDRHGISQGGSFTDQLARVTDPETQPASQRPGGSSSRSRQRKPKPPAGRR